MKISIVIPTLNEEEAIGDVVRAVPQDKVVEIREAEFDYLKHTGQLLPDEKPPPGYRRQKEQDERQIDAYLVKLNEKNLQNTPPRAEIKQFKPT